MSVRQKFSLKDADVLNTFVGQASTNKIDKKKDRSFFIIQIFFHDKFWFTVNRTLKIQGFSSFFQKFSVLSSVHCINP